MEGKTQFGTVDLMADQSALAVRITFFKARWLDGALMAGFLRGRLFPMVKTN
jgi:hypothetical protein